MKRGFTIKRPVEIIIICILGFLIVIAFKPNFEKIYQLKTHHYYLKQKLLLEEKRNVSLNEEFNGLTKDPYYIEETAREKLGWCRPTETVYRFQTTPSNLIDGPSDSNK